MALEGIEQALSGALGRVMAQEAGTVRLTGHLGRCEARGGVGVQCGEADACLACILTAPRACLADIGIIQARHAAAVLPGTGTWDYSAVWTLSQGRVRRELDVRNLRGPLAGLPTAIRAAPQRGGAPSLAATGAAAALRAVVTIGHYWTGIVDSFQYYSWKERIRGSKEAKRK